MRAPLSRACTTVASVPSSRSVGGEIGALAAEDRADEPLPRRADEDGDVEPAHQLGQAGEHLEVVAHGLAEADPGIGSERGLGNPGGLRRRQPFEQEVADLTHDVVVAGVVLHRAGLTEHVHRDVAGPRAGDDVEDAGVEAPGGDVVDDDRTGVDGRGGDVRLGGVDADRHARVGGKALDDGDDAAALLVGRHRLRPGAGRLTADVEQIGPVGREPRGRARPRHRHRASGRRPRTSRG